MTEIFLQYTRLRPDVSIWQRGDAIYLATSGGPLRLRARPPADILETSGTNGTSLLMSLAPQILEGLHNQGFLITDDQALTRHSLYQKVAHDHSLPFIIVDSSLGRPIERTLSQLGIPTKVVHPDQPTISMSDDSGIVIVPFSLDEDMLREWSAIAAEHNQSVIAYLVTPTRLLITVLKPFLTPCLVCLTRRLRATYRAQDIADIPMEQPFGVSNEAAWPSEALSVASIAHNSVISYITSKEQKALSTAYLLEFDYKQFEIRRHPILRLPNCPSCSTKSYRAIELVSPLLDSDEGWTDPNASWEQMQVCVDPLTGIVSDVVIEETGTGGHITWAYTIPQTNTLWMSPVLAQASGSSAKWDTLQAKVSALGEALERYACGIYDRASMVRGTFAQLAPVAIDPRSLPLGSEKEYRLLNGRLVPYHSDLEIDWVKGVSLTTNSARLVPACAVYVPYKFPRREERLLRPISTGLAAGATRSEAILAGLYEVIERDAFVIYWENALAAPTIDLDTLPEGPARSIVEQFRADGLNLICKLVTTDLGIPAVVCMSIQWVEWGPLVAFSSRANLNFLTCLQRALEEHVQCRRSIRNWIQQKGVPSDEKPLRQMEDFFTYYCREDRMEYLSFVYEGEIIPVPDLESHYSTATAAVREVVRRLEQRGYEAIVVDITPVDVAECGISIIRSIVPGLQPVTFGRDFRHLGGSRLYQAPVWMGLRNQPLQEDQLNPHPMPGG
ncbi:MAG TPA: TOMM precursor leader peptide-binding protein [Ktedonobacteraceae bacterium]|jgi:ribosomal protein S12 methylthiotransferase accessory factor|nr:TOMM precursor leader peptide-binding protein [Ktedonobacteraceae bacterium]